MLGTNDRTGVIGGLDRLKLLIADAGEEFRLALAEQTRGIYRIRITQEGKETLQTMLDFKPDIAVLDMMLPGLDGVSILQAASDAGIRPVVLAVTKYASDYLVEAATRLNVAYLMVKPCDVKATVSRLKELTELRTPSEKTGRDPRVAASNMLLKLSVSTKLRGYAYLREAVAETVRCPGQMVTKELYPKVGKLCDATSVQVERSIRSAIAKAWEQRDEVIWRHVFRTQPGSQPERPTNAVFISQLAEWIILEDEIG